MKARKESPSEAKVPVSPEAVLNKGFRGANGTPARPAGNGAPVASPSAVNLHDASALLHEFLNGLQAMRAGDFSARMATDHVGLAGKIADTFNDIVSANQRMAVQLERVGEAVGHEGKTRNRVKF